METEVQKNLEKNLKRVCRCCKIEKNLEDFPYDKSYLIGNCRRTKCKECLRKVANKWRNENKEKIKEYNKKNINGIKIWREKNKEKLKEKRLEYYKKNKETIKIVRKKYLIKFKKNNPELYKEKMRVKRKKYTLKHPEKIKERVRKYTNRRYHNDKKYNLNNRISKAIRKSLRGNKRGRHWEDLVGYTVEQLIKSLQGKFKNGMGWNNMGKWHVDHKIPISAFNFKSPSDIDFKKCWALDNLQPLWKIDNLEKKDKLIKPHQPSLSFS